MEKQITVILDVFDLEDNKTYKSEIYKGDEKDYKGPIGCFDEGTVHYNYLIVEENK